VVLATVGAISVFVALGAPGDEDEPTLATPIPEALRGLGPAGTIEITTPAPLTPALAAEASRPDCPQDWAVYHDPDGYFSLCYPADFFAIVAEPQAYFGYTFSVYSVEPPAPLPSDGISLTIYWSESGTPDLGATIDPCDPVSHWRDVKQVTLTLAERTVQVCAGDETGIAHHGPGTPTPARGTFGEIPVGPNQGYVVISIAEVGTTSNIESEPLASIFGSLRIGQ
jgi:hypothetical protein